MEITDFNLAPNLQWFVKVINNTTTFGVDIFKTLADSISSINRIAYSINNAFTAATEVSLINDTTYPTISKFNNDIGYHLKVNISSGDATATYKVGPFYDLSINDELINSSTQQLDRSTFEINKGTHTKVSKNITLNHSSSRIDGSIIALNTDDFSNESNKIGSLEISYGDGLLLDNLVVYSYEDLKLYTS